MSGDISPDSNTMWPGIQPQNTSIYNTSPTVIYDTLSTTHYNYYKGGLQISTQHFTRVKLKFHT